MIDVTYETISEMIYFSVILIVTFAVVTAQQEMEDPYCFRFTWIGPKYNANSSFFNGTCDDVTKGAEVPCNRPLVVTDNSKVPNTTYMWHSYNRSDIACRLTPGSVCVKYTYYYNEALENITYMCTKVNIENGGPVTSNCYSEFQNGREIEVCVCLTHGGLPCNAANTNSFTFGSALFMSYCLIYFYLIFNACFLL